MGIKGQVCEARTIVTRFQVCSLYVYVFASRWSWDVWVIYNVVVKLLISVWNVLSLWKKVVYLVCVVSVFFMVLYLCRHWLLSCVRCLDDPGAGFQTKYQQSLLSFAVSLSPSLSYMNIHERRFYKPEYWWIGS